MAERVGDLGCTLWSDGELLDHCRCEHDDRWIRLDWSSSQSRALMFSAPLLAIATFGSVGWVNQFVVARDWVAMGDTARFVLGLVAVVAALIVSVSALLAFLMLRRVLFLPRSVLVERNRIVPIGPFGIRYPWQVTPRPADPTVVRQKQRYGEPTYAVTLKTSKGRTMPVAKDIHFVDAKFLVTHMRMGFAFES